MPGPGISGVGVIPYTRRAVGLRGGAASYSDVVLSYSPLAYYKLNEASGTDAADSSGNGYTGVATGVTWADATGPNGIAVPYFDGLNDWVQINAAAAQFSGDNQVLVSLWAKTTQAEWEDAVSTILFEIATTTIDYIRGQVLQSAPQSSWRTIGRLDAAGVAAPSDGPKNWPGAWQHFLGLLDATNGDVKLWIDGTLKGSATTPGSPTTLTFTTGGIGSDDVGATQTQCWISDFAIWKNITPSAQMITDLSTAIP